MVIDEYKLPCGATVFIHDDYMAAPGSEAELRAKEAQNRAAWEIMKNVQEGRQSVCRLA